MLEHLKNISLGYAFLLAGFAVCVLITGAYWLFGMFPVITTALWFTVGAWFIGKFWRGS